MRDLIPNRACLKTHTQHSLALNPHLSGLMEKASIKRFNTNQAVSVPCHLFFILIFFAILAIAV